jgi:hypothetical protein
MPIDNYVSVEICKRRRDMYFFICYIIIINEPQ